MVLYYVIIIFNVILGTLLQYLTIRVALIYLIRQFFLHDSKFQIS